MTASTASYPLVLLAISKFGPARVKKILGVSEHFRALLNDPDGLDGRIFISKIINRIVVSENYVVITINLMPLFWGGHLPEHMLPIPFGHRFRTVAQVGNFDNWSKAESRAGFSANRGRSAVH